MKYKENHFITGYVTIVATGERPEMFFQYCNDQNITVWDVSRINEHSCQGNIKLEDVKSIKHLKRSTGYKINFKNKQGYPFMIRRLLRKKQILLGMIVSLLLVLFLSNILWKVSVEGVSTEMEEKIYEQLESYGIHPGSWVQSLESSSSIQQRLIHDLPELLWVGVHRKGTTFQLEGVEKVIVKREKVQGPRHLVATKKGVIKSMYISKGLPKVKVNDYVEPGDMLVSGIINDKDEESSDEKEEKEEKKDQVLVAAEGDVIANTWYEVSVTIPLSSTNELLTGEKSHKHYLGMGTFRIPIWGFKKPDYQASHREINENPIYFLKWKLPVNKVETIISEKVYNKTTRTKEEAIEVGILQAKKELQLQLGPESHIQMEKVLHESTVNGKVKLDLYVSVEENITKEERIIQGD
ncbi:MAG TPA: sporulation protein YqfD [Virgibacillus sp.]|nr:sporulation protein YqfD [Virgibacillus sp.]